MNLTPVANHYFNLDVISVIAIDYFTENSVTVSVDGSEFFLSGCTADQISEALDKYFYQFDADSSDDLYEENAVIWIKASSINAIVSVETADTSEVRTNDQSFIVKGSPKSIFSQINRSEKLGVI